MSRSEPYKLRGHIVEPRSTLAIRSTAQVVRELLNLPDGKFSLEKLLESLFGYGITVDVVEDEDSTFLMAGVEAVCVPETATIVLPESTYNALRRGDPRTKFTLFHELGHLILKHSKVLARRNTEAKPYLDSEWQADQFSAEIIMPLDVIKKRRLFSTSAIENFFAVSNQAANFRLDNLRKTGFIK